jgi:hypothetical protein
VLNWLLFILSLLLFIPDVKNFFNYFSHFSHNTKNVQSYTYNVNKLLNKQVFPENQKLDKNYKSENLKQPHKFIKPNNSIWKKVEKISKWIGKIGGWIYKIPLLFSIFESSNSTEYN